MSARPGAPSVPGHDHEPATSPNRRRLSRARRPRRPAGLRPGQDEDQDRPLLDLGAGDAGHDLALPQGRRHPGLPRLLAGDGDQTIRFHTPSPIRVDVVDRPGEPADFTPSVGLDATADRSAEFRSKLELGYSAASVGGDVRELAPLVPDNRLRLRGVQPSFGGSGLLRTFQRCPLMVDSPGRVEADGQLIQAAARLPESRLFKGATRLLASTAGVQRYAFPRAAARRSSPTTSRWSVASSLRRVVRPGFALTFVM